MLYSFEMEDKKNVPRNTPALGNIILQQFSFSLLRSGHSLFSARSRPAVARRSTEGGEKILVEKRNGERKGTTEERKGKCRERREKRKRKRE